MSLTVKTLLSIALLSLIIGAAGLAIPTPTSTGGVPEEQPETKLPPLTGPIQLILASPVRTVAPFPPIPTPPIGPLQLDVEIQSDNTQPILDKGSTTTLNLTIIGNNVTGGTSISFGYEMFAVYADGINSENPPEINLTFNPQQVVFPKTVNRTDTPYKLYSNLTIKAIPTSPDAYYYITIKIDKNLNIYTQQIHLRVGKGGINLPNLASPYDELPRQGEDNVSVKTDISVSFGRASLNHFAKLDMKPDVEIGNITKVSAGIAGATYTFHPARPLQPSTTYTVNITYGEKGYWTSSISWQFTTERGAVTISNASGTKIPKTLRFGIAIGVISIFLLYLFKKMQGKI